MRTTGKQCGLAATGDYQPSLCSPWLAAIGITTDLTDRREKELLGTISPVKISIVKAWTGVDARMVESKLHTILDNTRLDGEYFWDGNETLVDAVSDFINVYHPEAKEIGISDEADVTAATEAVKKKNSQRVYAEISPMLEELNIKHKITKNSRSVRFKVGDYDLALGARSGGRYTLTIWSKSKSNEEALNDFLHSQELSANGSEDSSRRARIPMSSLDMIKESIVNYMGNKSPNNGN